LESNGIFTPFAQYGQRNRGRAAAMAKMMTGFVARLREFARARRGNVAMMFGLALVPLVIAGGVGLDLARGMMVRSAMSEALDAAALAVGSTKGLDRAAALDLAQKYFNANYKGDAAYGTPTVTIGATDYSSAGSVKITATDPMPTTLMKIAGFQTIPISTSTTVVWGQSKLWVALALDNTGSMCEPEKFPCDSSTTSTIKINALKTATNQLLDILAGAAATAGDVQASIVPFNQYVRWDPSNTSKVDWTDWESQPANVDLDGKTDLIGPGDDCPFTTSSNGKKSPYGYYCMDSAIQGSANTTSIIPKSGTYKGYICPGVDSGSYNDRREHRFYNGCYTSTATGSTKQVSSGSYATCDGYYNCTCSGSGWNKKCNANYYKHKWVTNAHSTWKGCVMDRVQDADTYDTSTNSAGYPAVNLSDPSNNGYDCPVASAMGLSSTWATLKSKVSSMIAAGGTNQTIGLAHAMETMTASGAFGAGTLPANTARYIILLSDGLNTIDRWYGNGSSHSGDVDDRMALACQHAKDQKIIVYTIMVDPGGAIGDSQILQACASDSSKYYHLTTAGAIIDTFNQIAQQITNVRVSK
jgi:Flp pilus assembly protein TadG